MMNKKRGLLVLCMILLLGSLVSAIPQTFSVHGKLENNAGSPLEGTYNMSFNIYTTYTGGSASWTLSNQDVTTDSNGIYNIVLTNVNLDFGSQYYLGVTVGNDSEMSPRINLTSSPYAFEAQNVSVSGVRFNSNVDFGTNYNFTFDGGTLFVDGSKGYVGIGTITPNATLHIVKPGVSGGNGTVNPISRLEINSAANGGPAGLNINFATRTNTEDSTSAINVTGTLAKGTVFKVEAGGNVGIGTSSPQQKLDVVGNINSTGFINATTDVCIQGGACLSSVSASAGGWTKTGTQ